MLFEPVNRRIKRKKNHKINHEVSLSMEKSFKDCWWWMCRHKKVSCHLWCQSYFDFFFVQWSDSSAVQLNIYNTFSSKILNILLHSCAVNIDSFGLANILYRPRKRYVSTVLITGICLSAPIRWMEIILQKTLQKVKIISQNF